MLVVDDLHVRYGTTEAVRGVSFDVGVGCPVALLGANGAGKSSTLLAVSRAVPSSGRIRFAERDLRDAAPEDVARAGLIHVPEGRRMFRDLTVHENLLVGRTARGGRRPDYDVDDVYDLFPPLRPLRDRLSFTLSGGEAQMVAIGRGLVAAPRMMLIDEPSLGLAPIVVETVVAALCAISARTAVLLVEQNVHVAARICPQALVMVAGQIVLRRESADLLDSPDLLATYLGAPA